MIIIVIKIIIIIIIIIIKIVIITITQVSGSKAACAKLAEIAKPEFKARMTVQLAVAVTVVVL